MTIDQLKEQVSKYGDIVILKEGYVFTAVIKRRDINLSAYKTHNAIMKLLCDYTEEKYPYAEAVNTDSDLFVMILRPDERS